MNGIFKVKRVCEKAYVNSRSGGQTAIRSVVLKALGNDYTDEFVVKVFGAQAERSTYGTLVAANLRFFVTEYQGKYYQEVTAEEIAVIS